MAEKATLLQSVPPLGKKTTSDQPARSEVQPGVNTGSEIQAESGASMSAFQAVTYGSFVLTFILAGFAAVVLFRKALDTAERRLGNSAKAIGGAFVLMALHGFFATYIYTRYLRAETDAAPVSLTMLFWLVLAATVGYLTNRLLVVNEKMKSTEAAIDIIFHASVFILITLAVSPATNANISLILSLLALILYTVPLARFFIAYKAVKFRHTELQEKSLQRLLYSLILLPALLPLLGLFYLFNAFGPDATLLATNLTSSLFILMATIGILGSIKALKGQQPTEAREESPAKATQPTMDPLVAELLAEEEAAQTKKATAPPQVRPVPERKPERPARPNLPKKPGQQPSKPPSHPGQPKSPQKPGPDQAGGGKAPPNTPPTIKAPAKPKKRF